MTPPSHMTCRLRDACWISNARLVKETSKQLVEASPSENPAAMILEECNSPDAKEEWYSFGDESSRFERGMPTTSMKSWRTTQKMLFWYHRLPQRF
jgi:hypothetical protein